MDGTKMSAGRLTLADEDKVVADSLLSRDQGHDTPHSSAGGSRRFVMPFDLDLDEYQAGFATLTNALRSFLMAISRQVTHEGRPLDAFLPVPGRVAAAWLVSSSAVPMLAPES